MIDASNASPGASAANDPRFEEETCFYCDGDGCEACNDTGRLYTQAAIRLQMIERGELDADDDA